MPVKIHVITLADATERRQQVRAQLDTFGLRYAFFDAADGKQGAEMFDTINTRQHLMNTGRLPTPGEVGCYASHLGIWRKIVVDKKPACILEDDCHLEEFFPAALETAAQVIDQYGFIRLQTESRAKKTLVHNVNDFQLFRYTKMAHSTLAYVIAPAVAKSFIEHSAIMECPVDIFIKQFWVHGNALHGLTPYAARESAIANDSSIGSRIRPRKDLVTRLARVSAKARSGMRRAAFNRAHKSK